MTSLFEKNWLPNGKLIACGNSGSGDLSQHHTQGVMIYLICGMGSYVTSHYTKELSEFPTTMVYRRAHVNGVNRAHHMLYSQEDAYQIVYGNSLQETEPKPQMGGNIFQEKDALLQDTTCTLNQRAFYAIFSPSRKNGFKQLKSFHLSSLLAATR